MKIKYYSFLILLCVCCTFAFGQKDTLKNKVADPKTAIDPKSKVPDMSDPKANLPDPTSLFKVKNISKTNVLLGPFFKQVYVIQERALSKRISVVTSVRTRIPTSFKGGKFGKINTAGHGDYDPFSSMKLSGIGNITEFRLYGKKRGAMHGVYGELFFSYMHYKLQSGTFPATFHDNAGVAYKADVTQTFKLNNTGGGLGFGVQGLFIKDRLCIDWTILRLGVSMLGLSGGIEATNTSDNFDFRNYTDDVNNASFGLEKLKVFKRDIQKESVDMGIKLPFVIVQMGLNIGFGY
jgi:hypothetical protein